MTQILESLLHADAVGVDDSLQQTGLECLLVLGIRFRSPASAMAARAVEIVRRFLGSPALHPSDDPSSLTPVLKSAARCYAGLLAASTITTSAADGETGSAASETAHVAAVQSLLNQLASAERQTATVDGAGEAGMQNGSALAAGETAANLVHAVALLAKQSGSIAVSRIGTRGEPDQ